MYCNSIRQTRIFNTYEDASFIHFASTLHYHAEIPPSCYRLTRNTQIYSDIVVHLLQSHGKLKGVSVKKRIPRRLTYCYYAVIIAVTLADVKVTSGLHKKTPFHIHIQKEIEM